MAVSKTTATHTPGFTFILCRARSMAFDGALIHHDWGGTPLAIWLRPPWLWMENTKRGKTQVTS